MNSSTSSSEGLAAGPALSARAYLICLVAALFVLFGGTALAVWVIDPLQVFRRSSLYEPVVLSDERTQNAGLLRNYPADSIIIGSSISQACRSDEFERLLGGDFLRISSAGLTARELSLYLDVRFRRHKPRRVYDIQYWYTFARENAAGFREEFGEFPEHLYRMPALERAKYLINFDNIALTRRIIAEILGGERIERVPFVARNSPELDPKRVKGKESVLKLYRQITGGAKPDHAFIKAERDRMTATFASIYEPLIEANPDVEFHIVLPPFSLAYYQAFNKSGVYRLNTILQFRGMLADLRDRRKNVVLHDLAADYDEITNYDNYFDTHHFSEATCTRMAERIAANPEGDASGTVRANSRSLRKWVESSPPPS